MGAWASTLGEELDFLLILLFFMFTGYLLFRMIEGLIHDYRIRKKYRLNSLVKK